MILQSPENLKRTAEVSVEGVYRVWISGGNWGDDERKKFFLSAVSREQDFLGIRNSRGSNIPLK